jgi:hypothetical protein
VNLQIFNLASVLKEIGRWMKEGTSLFAEHWQALQENFNASASAETDTG